MLNDQMMKLLSGIPGSEHSLGIGMEEGQQVIPVLEWEVT